MSMEFKTLSSAQKKELITYELSKSVEYFMVDIDKTIDKYNDLPGFCNFTSGFHIESIVISQKAKHIDSKKVYILTTTQILDDDEITVSYCVYLSFFSAKLAQIMKSIVSYWKKKRKYYVSKHCINQPEWTEGFNIIC